LMLKLTINIVWSAYRRNRNYAKKWYKKLQNWL